MKKGAGKNKGAQFERDVARILDVWWEVPPHTFWRSVNSGGVWEPGDITPRDSSIKFPFIVECKFYKQLDFMSLLKDPTKSLIYKWFHQVTSSQASSVLDKKFSNKNRLLIVKFNRSPIFCVYSLKELKRVPDKCLILKNFYMGEDICMCNFEDFMKIYSKSYFSK